MIKVSQRLLQQASAIKFNFACWSSMKRTLSSSYQNVTCSRHDFDIAEKLLI